MFHKLCRTAQSSRLHEAESVSAMVSDGESVTMSSQVELVESHVSLDT